MWDIVALCAANERQSQAFRRQLEQLYAHAIDGFIVRVYADEPAGVKVGTS